MDLNYDSMASWGMIMGQRLWIIHRIEDTGSYIEENAMKIDLIVKYMLRSIHKLKTRHLGLKVELKSRVDTHESQKISHLLDTLILILIYNKSFYRR